MEWISTKDKRMPYNKKFVTYLKDDDGYEFLAEMMLIRRQPSFLVDKEEFKFDSLSLFTPIRCDQNVYKDEKDIQYWMILPDLPVDRGND